MFFMWKKDETFSKLLEFKELVEKEADKKVKDLRINNGGEYVRVSLKISVQKKEFDES